MKNLKVDAVSKNKKWLWVWNIHFEFWSSSIVQEQFCFHFLVSEEDVSTS